MLSEESLSSPISYSPDAGGFGEKGEAERKVPDMNLSPPVPAGFDPIPAGLVPVPAKATPPPTVPKWNHFT